MAKDVKLYRVFVSSPGDMAKQRNVIKETVAGLSATYERKGVTLSAWLWEEDASSEFGQAPQDAITKQLGGYDLYIGLMGTRFGSPTSRYGSGTEQEFMEALEAHQSTGSPEVAFYFKVEQIASNLSRDALEQLTKMMAFKEKIGPLGLYREFTEDHELSIEVSKFIDNALSLRASEVASLSHQYILPTQAAPRTPSLSKLFYQDFLNATGEDLKGGMSANITLDQIWVEPELRLISEDSVRNGIMGTPHPLDGLLSSVQDGAHYLISGGETCGKTSLCKTLFVSLFEKGYFPAFLSGDRISSPDLSRFEMRVRLAYAEQYNNVDVDCIGAEFLNRQVVIVDDFDLLRLNPANAKKLLSGICESYSRVVITAAPTFAYGMVERGASSVRPVILQQVQILEFGKHRRSRLIDRWCSVGSADPDEESLRTTVEEKRRTVDRMLSANLVPRTPLVVLILLKAIELGQAGDLAHAGYVRYYKFLIDSAILKNISREEAEGAYALLPEIAWVTYSSSSRELAPQQIERVIEEFSQRRALRKTSLYSVLGSLRTINMFELSGGSHKFKFTYTFYFFLADYISRNLDKKEMQEEVRKLCATVSKKESADILAFLAFHTDASIIIETLIEGVSTLYPEAPPFDLSKARNAAINTLIYEMPKQVVDYTKSEERRAQHLTAEEAIETQNSNAETTEAEQHGSPFETMTTTLRAVEILGHIIRNHYTRLDAEPKIKIIKAATGATLRCLGDMFDHLSKSVDAVVTAVRLITDKFDNEADEKKKQEIANNMVFLLAAGLFVHFSKSLARAVGDENLEITYQTVLGDTPQVISQYLDALIKLDCFRQFPLREVRALVEKIGDNQLALISLRHAVIERLDMRPPSKPADMQRFCDAVGIRVVPRLVARSRR